jgi:chromosome segregation ATPase
MNWKINELEIQLRSREATESEIRQINQDLETRCQDYESSIASIQPKYQEALNDRGRFEHELNLALLRQTNLRKDLDNKDAELTKLREQKTALDAELTDARAALSSSSIPEIAEMGKLKEELAKERSEKERLQKRLTNMQGDLEYMRNNYQNSSTMAAEHASENQALQAEVAELREKAKENTVRIHEIQESAEIEEYVRRIRELKEENGELERELERKSEELKALMNGRRATRGTSVPRSPRMGTGGTMSPGPRPMGRAMQMGGIGMAMGGVIGGGNGGSRGNSPGPGELGGFRGTGTFVGEALFQERGAPGGVRWGNHLQQ